MQVQFTIENLEYFLFIVTRVSAFVFTAPFFNFGEVPRKFKFTFTLMFSVLLYLTPSVHNNTVIYTGIAGFTLIIFSEAMAGALLGFFTNIVMTILNFTGRLIDMEIGFAMVTLYDPVFRVQSSVSGNLYSYFIILLLLLGNFQHYFIKAFVDTYSVVPVGRAFINDTAVAVMTTFLADYFLIAMRLMLPIYATMLLVNAVLGVMAKVAPQMNMFVVGIQLKVFAGFIVLILMMAMLPGVADFIISEMKEVFLMAVEVIKQ